MFIKEEYNTTEYIAYYEITGYNMEENQDDYIAKELPSWVNVIKRYGKPDIHIMPNKIRVGVHSEYEKDVTIDYIEYCLNEILGYGDKMNDDTTIIVEQIPVPNLYKDEKYYIVDADEFADKETMEDYWNDSFVGWGDADVDFPDTFKKFIKQCLNNGFARLVEEVR